MPKTFEDRITAAQAMIEEGFLSMAGKKRANEELSAAYDLIKRVVADAILDARGTVAVGADHRFQETPEQAALTDLYYRLPDLHVVREKHYAMYAEYPEFAKVKDLVNLRQMVKDAEIIPVKRDAQIERVEAVRRSILEEMEFRKAQFVEGMEVARLFNGLPVSVNAHLVYGHKGTVFVRHFFYLRGKLTPLNMIIGIADAYKREKEGGAQ